MNFFDARSTSFAQDSRVIEFLRLRLLLQKAAGAGFPRVRPRDRAEMARVWNVKSKYGGLNVQLLLKDIAQRFVRDESGATAIEYGLIAAGISVAIILVVNTLGTQVSTTFSNVSSSLANAGK